MDNRAWYKNKKGFFYILVLLQTGVIIFTATYVVLSVHNTEKEKNVWKNGRHRRYYDLKSRSRGKENDGEGLNAFNIVVRAKGRIIDNNGGNKSMDLTSLNGKRINGSDVKNYNLENNNGNMNIDYNNDNNYHVSKHKKNRNKKYRKKKRNKNYKNIRKRMKKNSSNIKGNNHNNNNDNNHNNNNNNNYQTSPTELTPTNQRKPILMFIAIMSAPERIHRRNALRRSWLRQCQQHNTSCYMFTDALDMYGKRLRDEILIALEQEQFLHQDLILAESPGGINFATRYLWIIKWANRNYKFDFLLRVDDDYFICMDRLFLELPYRKMVRKLYWGHIHCYPPGKF